jgi:fructose-bisphosphate aldolase class II
MSKYRAGVLFGDELEALYNDAKDNQFALPAVNCIGTNSINATLETAAKVNSPVIIQFSNGGAQFVAGKGMPNDKLQGNIAGRFTHSQRSKTLRCTRDFAYRSCFQKMVAMGKRPD